MSAKENISELLLSHKEDSEAFFSYLLDLMQRIQEKAQTFGDPSFNSFLEKERARLNVRVKKFEKFTDASHSEVSKEVEKLIKEINTFSSNNYFLEYKRNDLMLLAQDLEDANEEISKKNDELEIQKVQIEAQAQELEKSHSQILAKNQELVSLNNEKNNLIGIVAHDLKSPLNQIKGLISIIKLKSDGLDAEMLNYIGIIEGSVSRLSGMINKILDVEAIEAKKLNIKIEEFDLAHVVEEVCKGFEITAEAKHIQIHRHITSESCRVSLDKAYTVQVFENLISNAIKFSPKWGDVSVNLGRKNGKIICEVNDKGPGISDSDKKKLFLKYQKLSAKPTGNEGSTGLGLSIVKKYVEAMDGSIWCESEEGKGASFFVSFKGS